jgi:hypothetical protein
MTSRKQKKTSDKNLHLRYIIGFNIGMVGNDNEVESSFSGIMVVKQVIVLVMFFEISY